MLQVRMPSPSSLTRESGRFCASQARTFDYDRYVCALAAKPGYLRPLMALLAFNVEIARTRELVHEPTLGEIRLQWWREGLAEAFSGRPRSHPVLEEVADLAAGLSQPLMQALVDGRARDLADEPFADLAALEGYLASTAGRLAEALARACGAMRAATFQAAQAVGFAWGMVGIVRAVPFHASVGRVLLPADMLAANGVAEASLRAGTPQAGLASVLEGLTARASGRLTQARALRREIEIDALPALLPAGLADLYVRRLEKSRFRIFESPIALGPLVAPASVMWNAVRKRY